MLTKTNSHAPPRSSVLLVFLSVAGRDGQHFEYLGRSDVLAKSVVKMSRLPVLHGSGAWLQADESAVVQAEVNSWKES